MQRIRTILAAKKPVTWLFTGDSITHGALHTMGWRDYTELFRERVVWEMQRPNDVVINTAFSGYTVRGLLAEYDLRVGRFTPDVVFIMIGMNDCNAASVPLAEFAQSVRTLADRILGAGGLPVLQTTSPVVVGKAPGREEHLPTYMDAIRKVATTMRLPLIDHYADWEARGEQRRFYLMSDPFHPNECGHRAFAQRIFRDIGMWDDASYMCRLFVP